MNDKLNQFDKDHISLQKELKVLNQKIQSILNEKQSELKLSSPNLNLVQIKIGMTQRKHCFFKFWIVQKVQSRLQLQIKIIQSQENQKKYLKHLRQIIIQEMTPGQGKDSQKFKEVPCQLTNQLKNDQKEQFTESTITEVNQIEPEQQQNQSQIFVQETHTQQQGENIIQINENEQQDVVNNFIEIEQQSLETKIKIEGKIQTIQK